MNRKGILLSLCLTLLLLAISRLGLAAEAPFPMRAIFPKVPVMELEELYRKRNDVVIIDVRSSYEYDTLHIQGARHLSLSDKDFAGALGKLRAEDQRPFVFYCNGHTCKKSYHAVQKAQLALLDNIFAYDAGIFSWTKAHPEAAVLLGKSPADPKRLISSEQFEAHLLAPNTFGERVSGSSIVLDIRDVSQKNAINLFPMQQHSVPLDNNKLKRFVDEAKEKGKTLLVYDAVGKQVRWLQYFLEEEGLTDYFFMKDGAKGFLDY